MDSLLDGIFATVMIALVETFGIAAAVALGVPALPLALLSSLPVWVGTMIQLRLRSRVAGACRKPLIVRAVRLQALSLVGLAATGWFPGSIAPWLYVAGFVLHGASNAAVSHLWMSWFSDICPAQVLGRHTAWRSSAFALVQLVVALTAGVLAARYQARATPWHVFALVFSIAGAARLASSAFLSRQYEPAPEAVAPMRSAFTPSSALRRFSVAIALLQGAAVMAGPFFAVWFLRDLRFSYWIFAAVGAATLVGNLLCARVVGQLADRYGAARVLSTSAVLAATVPFPYLVVESPGSVAAANFYSGAAWAGVNVSAFKYLIGASRGDPTRSGIVYANVWLTSSVLLFSIAGGVLATRLPVLFEWRLQTLFALSGIIRILIALLLFPTLTEVEVTERTRRGGPGRFFQLFRWKGPGTSQT